MNDSWQQKAEQISSALASEPHDGKMLRIEHIARDQGLSPQTAHHLLRAHDFVARLRANDGEIVTLIERLSYQGVLAAERWYGRDRAKLLAYLTTYQEPSVRQLAAAEKASRSVTSAAGMPAHHAIEVMQWGKNTGCTPGAVLTSLMDWARLEVFDLTALVWKPETREYERSHGIEYHALTPTQDAVALLVGPNSQTAGHFMRNAKLIWFNAASATSLFPLVIVLLPSKAAQSACLTTMPLPPSGEDGWPEWNSVKGARGQPRSGPARPASPRAGIILFTTPEDILVDWQT
jgi:hypothetical protein